MLVCPSPIEPYDAYQFLLELAEAERGARSLQLRQSEEPSALRSRPARLFSGVSFEGPTTVLTRSAYLVREVSTVRSLMGHLV